MTGMSRRVLLALTAALATTVSGCSSDSESAELAAIAGLRSDSAGGLVMAPSTPYKATGATAPGALVVTLSGESTTPDDAIGCAPSKPGSAFETVFWVDGIREGKALPQDRRYELVSAPCGIAPRIQGVVVGGTINVFNDAGEHRLVFVRAGTADTLQTMPFKLAGSVVATERLTKTPGIVDVGCALHPGERSYIAVFDHPYFGVASSGEKVTLDAVPPGNYRVMTWHEGLPTPSSVATKVGASGQTDVIVK